MTGGAGDVSPTTSYCGWSSARAPRCLIGLLGCCGGLFRSVSLCASQSPVSGITGVSVDLAFCSTRPLATITAAAARKNTVSTANDTA